VIERELLSAHSLQTNFYSHCTFKKVLWIFKKEVQR
jgi:hypothetical protein